MNRNSYRSAVALSVTCLALSTGPVLKAQSVEEVEAKPGLKQLTYTTSWLGNTFGFGDGKHVQNDVQYLWVKPDGTVYTGSNWDEGHYAGGIYKAGDQLGTLQDTFQDFAGIASLGGDDHYIYAARNNGTIRRYQFDGGHAAFAGGAGGRKNEIVLKGVPGHLTITALAVDAKRHLLYAAIESRQGKGVPSGAVQVFDISDGVRFVRGFVAPPDVRALTVASDGTLWAGRAKSATKPGGVIHIDAGGQIFSSTLSAGEGFDPVALCCDATGRIWAADGGPDQNIKMFTAGDGKLRRTLGVPGGVFSGPTPGRVGPLRFNGITGVGVDAAGLVYVSQNRFGPHANGYAESGTILECYQPVPAPGGKDPDEPAREWVLHGLEFVDCADVDPASGSDNTFDAYTKLAHYAVDLSKPNGHQWTYVGTTLDFTRYPTDDRFASANDNGNIRGGAWVRRLQGRKVMFVTTMGSSHMTVYRFDDAHGETAIPCGRIERDHVWCDTNGNGTADPGETLTGPGVPGPLWMSYWVDSNGDIWQSTDGSGKTGVRHFKFAGFNPTGSPLWDYDPSHFTQEINHLGPEPFSEIYRVEYQAGDDTMFLTGYSSEASSPAHNLFPGYGYRSPAYATKNVGPIVARYDHWLRGNRKPAWAVRIPYGGVKHNDEHGCAAAISIAGDYFFVGYEGLFNDADSGRIQVYRTRDGGYVGTLHAGPESGNIEGAMDIPHGVRAIRRASGEYLVFSEDDWHAKVLMYRWTPDAKP